MPKINWNTIVDFIRLIEPLLLVIIPLVYGFFFKLRHKFKDKKKKLTDEERKKNEQIFSDWRHEESINVTNKLNNMCNYYADIAHVNVSYIQLENGTIATSKLCNMFFSCIAEDSRFSQMQKLKDKIQRVPFVRMSEWFNSVSNSSHKVVYLLNDKKEIDSVFHDTGINCMVSSLVRDPKGLVIGICNFMLSEEYNVCELDEKELVNQMIKFTSSIETIFFNYNMSMKQKAEELKITINF